MLSKLYYPSFKFKLDDPPSQIQATLPLRDSYQLGGAFNSEWPSPQIRVTNKAVIFLD